MNFIDLTGKRYGRLVVIKLDHIQKQPCGRNERHYLCKCDCGNNKVVRACSLRSGNTTSCGCYQKELLTQRQSTHKMSKTPLYKAWCNMKMRCTNPNYTDYYDYGGRGISVCEEWQSFDNFKEWAFKNGYKDEKKNGKNLLSLDRIDVNGNYCPENCRWATYSQQANNKRNTRRFYFDGQYLTAREWSVITGINYGTLVRRLHKPSWTIERALTEPTHKDKQSFKTY